MISEERMDEIRYYVENGGPGMGPRKTETVKLLIEKYEEQKEFTGMISDLLSCSADSEQEMIDTILWMKEELAIYERQRHD